MSAVAPILIVGATGQQGSAVLRALQAMPNAPAIRALTRSTDSPRAQELKKRGVEVVKGTLSDVESLKRALEGASAAFLGTSPIGSGQRHPEADVAVELAVTLRGVDGGIDEDQQGYNFIEAANAVCLPYLVYTSVSDATVDCGVPHFETKAKVEVALKESGLRHAVVAPTGFYDNFPRKSSMASFFGMGLFDAGLHGAPLQMVAVDDIGKPFASFSRCFPFFRLVTDPQLTCQQARSPLRCSLTRKPTPDATSSSPATSSRWLRSATRTLASKSAASTRPGCLPSSSTLSLTTSDPCSPSLRRKD